MVKTQTMDTTPKTQLVLFPDDTGRQSDGVTTDAKQAHKGDPGKDARASKARTKFDTGDAPTVAQMQHWKSPVRLSQEALEAVLKLRRRSPNMTAAAKPRSHRSRE